MGSLLVFEFVFEKLVLYFALKENYLAVIHYANLVQVAYKVFNAVRLRDLVCV